MIYPDTFNFYFLIFTNLILVFILASFFCEHISLSPGNSHYSYRGTVECIFSCIYFCEHVTIEKNP